LQPLGLPVIWPVLNGDGATLVQAINAWAEAKAVPAISDIFSN